MGACCCPEGSFGHEHDAAPLVKFNIVLRSRCRMGFGLTVSLVALAVIAVLGALGYLMDKQVDRDERKDDHSSFSS